MSIKTPEDLGGIERVCRICVPVGIGDVSWVYSKIAHLKKMTGKETLMYVAGKKEWPRGGDLVELLPEVHFGGYLQDRSSWHCIMQSMPPSWPPTCGGFDIFYNDQFIINVAANFHLEQGNKLREWLPLLPIDYHYPLNIPPECSWEAAEILSGAGEQLIGVYVSNREKDKIRAGGWNLWDSGQWIEYLESVMSMSECKDGVLVFFGAHYDSDKTNEVADTMEAKGYRTIRVVGRPLGTALECMKKLKVFFAYPSGLGILANVLRVNTLMLLPWILEGLHESYADPIDIAYNRYKTLVSPTTQEATSWFRTKLAPLIWP